MDYSKNITCRHCGNISYMDILGTIPDIPSEDASRYSSNDEIETYYHVLRCPACKKLALFHMK